METAHLFSVSKHTDGASKNSAILNYVKPRSFSLAEVALLVKELIDAHEYFSKTLAFCSAHQSKLNYLNATSTDQKVVASTFVNDPAGSVQYGLLQMVGVKLVREKFALVSNLVTASSSADVSLTLNNSLVSNFSAHPAVVNALISKVAMAMYRSGGSLFEELSGSLLKGTCTSSSISPMARASIIKFMDKSVRQRIDALEGLAITSYDGVISGDHQYQASVLAESLSMPMLRALCPALSAWLFDGQSIGTELV